jgi:hypothetical protein
VVSSAVLALQVLLVVVGCVAAGAAWIEKNCNGRGCCDCEKCFFHLIVFFKCKLLIFNGLGVVCVFRPSFQGAKIQSRKGYFLIYFQFCFNYFHFLNVYAGFKGVAYCAFFLRWLYHFNRTCSLIGVRCLGCSRGCEGRKVGAPLYVRICACVHTCVRVYTCVCCRAYIQAHLCARNRLWGVWWKSPMRHEMKNQNQKKKIFFYTPAYDGVVGFHVWEGCWISLARIWAHTQKHAYEGFIEIYSRTCIHT